MLGIPHPYWTSSIPGVGGVIKERPEDFVVEEVPLYTACGQGEHTYFEIEKIDLSTFEALERLSRELRVEVKEFGYAGLKDRKGLTRQTISIAHVDPARIESIEIPQLRVLWARRHTNKLRIGHLRGNRFSVWIRDAQGGAAESVGEIVRLVAEHGLPNYYGPQRFGNRGDAHRVGRSFLRRDDRAGVRRILGHPSSTEQNPHVVRARKHFMAGEISDALDSFPSAYREERRLLAYLLEAGENYSGAKKRLRDSSRKLYFTAYQSYLFNLVLSERLRRTGGDVARLLEGDVAFLHRNGAVFRVVDAAAEEPRTRSFEVSPSGPIFGMRMPAPLGIEAEIEEEILSREGIQVKDFHQLMPHLRLDGGRRPFRVKVEDLVWRVEGADLYFEFFLPKGSYATTFFREVMKNELAVDGFYEEGEEEKHSLWRPPTPPPVEVPVLEAHDPLQLVNGEQGAENGK
ncbi:MAG TPA: tRNA pseudouridine(13) synthase TruD [Planctomycetota bacterium]|nr:tRNA pseudouridine(13) synthase TruD [Planctomycetota bacterium]